MLALTKRLRHYAEVNDSHLEPLLAIKGRQENAERGTELVSAGESIRRAFIVEQGWAIRFNLLEDGRRQVLNVLMPGDMFDLQVFVAAAADHSVTAVTDMMLLSITPQNLLDVFYSSGRIGQALWWTAVQEEAILREQIVRIGRRSARERISHFLLELHRRALVVAEGDASGFRLPLTQTLIGDALGLTHIHVNRVLRRLKDEGFIERMGDWIELKDREGLAEICDFDPSYLHLDAYSRRLGYPEQPEG